jgi:O-6-methylguanine DNA methyltransferase
MLLKALLPTPLGPMLAVASDAGLCGLEFDVPERATRLWSRLRRWSAGAEAQDGHTPVFDAARAWLDAYFSSAAGRGPAVALDLRGTEFEREVWRVIQAIPAGRTTTYGDIAATLERRDASRAVGAAVGANPVSLIVPCHRVIGLDGGLTGYGGGLPRKEWLLRHEGVLLL